MSSHEALNAYLFGSIDSVDKTYLLQYITVDKNRVMVQINQQMKETNITKNMVFSYFFHHDLKSYCVYE